MTVISMSDPFLSDLFLIADFSQHSREEYVLEVVRTIINDIKYKSLLQIGLNSAKDPDWTIRLNEIIGYLHDCNVIDVEDFMKIRDLRYLIGYIKEMNLEDKVLSILKNKNIDTPETIRALLVKPMRRNDQTKSK